MIIDTETLRAAIDKLPDPSTHPSPRYMVIIRNQVEGIIFEEYIYPVDNSTRWALKINK